MKISKEKYTEALRIVLAYQKQLNAEYVFMRKNHLIDPEEYIKDQDISARLFNILRVADMGNFKLKDFKRINIQDLYQGRGFGKQSFKELNGLLERSGIFITI